MKSLPELRRAALEIFQSALASVDAAAAVRRAVRLDGPRLIIKDRVVDLSTRPGRNIYAIAIGKAAFSMSSALDEILRDRLTAGFITGPLKQYPSETVSSRASFEILLAQRWRAMHGGHPLPDEASLAAARHCFDLLRRANDERALVIFLISGGGSAMIEWPRNAQATLADLREANRLLVSCGANISEINSVRRAFSAIKGGGLGARAPLADQLTLIVSDTGAGDEASVASGPTLDPPLGAPSALDVIERYNLAARLPASLLVGVNQPPPLCADASQKGLRAHYVLLDNRRAIEAADEAARARGFRVETALNVIEQPVTEGCAELFSRLRALQDQTARVQSMTNGVPVIEASERAVVCLISGGEFACPVRGTGVGGRNAETTLRCAMEMAARAGQRSLDSSAWAHTVALSAGTDGIDGNSPAAGALADHTTLERARALGMDAQKFLDASDAYTFFDALGDAIMTGPTGTNVRDLRLLLAG